MNAPETPDTHRMIGAAVKRKEDYRFLTGNGQYTDDVVLPRQTYGVFLRSPHAHATIRSIDITAAKEAPGVVAVDNLRLVEVSPKHVDGVFSLGHLEHWRLRRLCPEKRPEGNCNFLP